MVFSQGDIIEVGFDPTPGHEPMKKRPAVVVSTDAFNLRSSLTFVAPITSTANGYPLHVPLSEDCEVHGCVCIEQIRSLDLSARSCRKLCEIGVEEMNEILNRLGPVFGL